MKNIYTVFLYLLFAIPTLKAEDLVIYEMMFMQHLDSAGFVSLSEIYYPDSLAIPLVREEEYDKSKPVDFKLNSKYRKQFLAGTKISETDKVFIYSYCRNILISFPVSNLNVMACLNMYAGDGPYSEGEYMFGFEINKKYLKDFEQYFINTLVYIGKESPFILNQMKPIAWKKTAPEKFPAAAIDTLKNPALKRFNYDSPDEYSRGDVYMYEANDLVYYVQNILSKKRNNELKARHVCVMNKKTKELLCNAVYVDGESTSPAPLNFVESDYVEQWTGKLFKNKPVVMLGFQYISFGCPHITFLSTSEKSIYINCDNRH